MAWTLDQKIATVGVATYFVAMEAEKQAREAGRVTRAKTLASVSNIGLGVAFGSVAKQLITKTFVWPDLGLLGTAALLGVGGFVVQRATQPVHAVGVRTNPGGRPLTPAQLRQERDAEAKKRPTHPAGSHRPTHPSGSHRPEVRAGWEPWEHHHWEREHHEEPWRQW